MDGELINNKMTINDKHNEITNKVFGGNAGMQSAYFRELIESIVLIVENNPTLLDGLDPLQKEEILKRFNDSKPLNSIICNALKIKTLEEMKPEEVIEE